MASSGMTLVVRTRDNVLAGSASGRRFNVLLLGLFSAVALLLAAVGIYGVMSCVVSQRTQEIGIRMALGARGTQVLLLVVGQGMLLAVLGLAAGVTAALALTRFLASLPYEVRPTDPAVFLVVALRCD